MKFIFSFCDFDSYNGSFLDTDFVCYPVSCAGVLSFINSSAFSSAWNCPAYQISFRRFMRSFGFTKNCCKDPVQFSVFYDSFYLYLISLRGSPNMDFNSLITFSFSVLDVD